MISADCRSVTTQEPTARKAFAFISEGENDQLALFRVAFAAGGTAQPVKVADLEAPLDGARDHIETLVRWN
jgi:hypothetical protein